MKSLICLIVKFDIEAGHKEEFVRIIQEHAKSTLAGEPGCLRFEVCDDLEEENRVFLFEMYRDAQAFEEHKASAILARTRERYADIVVSREIHISKGGRD